MKKTHEVRLTNVRLYAYHGYYAIEREIGNEFALDVITRWETEIKVKDDISKTVNYENLFILVEKEMMVAQQLLETVVENIADQIQIAYPFLNFIQVVMHKPVQLGGAVDKATIIETRYI